MHTERFLENCILVHENLEIYKDKKLIYSGPVECVKLRLGTWDKGDLFSNWFDNKTEGWEYDEEYYLPEDSIDELYDICKKIIANPKKAKKLLPSYCKEDYDEIVSTKEILEKALKDQEADFRYIITSY